MSEKQQQCSCNNQDRRWQSLVKISRIRNVFSCYCKNSRRLPKLKFKQQRMRERRGTTHIILRQVLEQNNVEIHMQVHSLITVQSHYHWLSLHLSLPISFTQAVYQDLLRIIKTEATLLVRHWAGSEWGCYFLFAIFFHCAVLMVIELSLREWNPHQNLHRIGARFKV